MTSEENRKAFMEGIFNLMDKYGVRIEGGELSVNEIIEDKKISDRWWFRGLMDDDTWTVDGDDLERHCNP